MLISTPFLPNSSDRIDDEWLDALLSSIPGRDLYPGTAGLVWHGGIHLKQINGDAVHAIADGVVVYVRQPTAKNADPAHPLNYHAGSSVWGWTSDGCVVIRHDTEIHQGERGKLCFYSISMHLDGVSPDLSPNSRVYRKDVIGRAGSINGQPGQIHFEIICDTENLARLTGRTSGDVSVATNGKADLYGEVYYLLPSGTKIYSSKPSEGGGVNSAVELCTTSEDLYVGIRCERHIYTSTYTPNGDEVGTTIKENDAEYSLLKNVQQLDCERQSDAYELLKFGRKLAGQDVADVIQDWRRVNFPGGQGWVNLQADGIRKYSDADFPHWRMWSIIEDVSDGDSRMELKAAANWLKVQDVAPTDKEQLKNALLDIKNAPRLRKLICRFPTEWCKSTTDARWGWLRSADGDAALSEVDYLEFRAHVAALAFWDEAALPIESNHWHFHPIEFIRQMRKCPWYSASELARCIPRRSASGNQPWNEAKRRATEHQVALNLFFAKYIGPDRGRHIHALAQIYIETGMLGTVKELGSGATKPYGAFYGRGYMQLTWASNYAAYGKFMAIKDSVHPTYSDSRITLTSTHRWADGDTLRQWAPRYDPEIVADDLSHSAESSGLYWISKRYRGKWDINRVCDLGVNPTTVAFISWLVNGGGNGYAARQQFAEYLRNILMDAPLLTGTTTLRYPALTPAGSPSLCASFPPVTTAYTLEQPVYHDRQISN